MSNSSCQQIRDAILDYLTMHPAGAPSSRISTELSAKLNMPRRDIAGQLSSLYQLREITSFQVRSEELGFGVTWYKRPESAQTGIKNETKPDEEIHMAVGTTGKATIKRGAKEITMEPDQVQRLVRMVHAATGFAAR